MYKLSFFLFIGIFCNALHAQKENLRLEIEKLIFYDTEISFKKTPGFIVGIIDGDSTYTIPFGNSKKNKKALLNEYDIFELGSITKVVTSSLISILVAEGTLSYDIPINEYLPEQFKNPRLNRLNLRNLINHTSGIPKRPAFFGKKEKDPHNPYEFYGEEDLLKFYRDFIPESENPVYSHTNYALVELIIEHVTQKNFGDLLKEKIFEPLSMPNSFVDFPEKRIDFITKGYNRSGKESGPWTFNSFKGSEALKSNMNDMLLFIKANLAFSGTTLDSIFSNNFVGSFPANFIENLQIVNGWHSVDMKNFSIRSHTGKTTGHSAFVAMVRETKTAVIILANSSIGTEDLGMQILRMINYNWKRKIPGIN